MHNAERLAPLSWGTGLALVLTFVANRVTRVFFGHYQVGSRQNRNAYSGLSGEIGLTEQVHDTSEREERVEQEEQEEQKRTQRWEFWSYIWGFGLALVLTLVPFALVYRTDNAPRFFLLLVIGIFALEQMVVHFRFFLRIGFEQKREDLHLILFSALLLSIMVAGTIWIMVSLSARMFPPMP